MSGAPLVAVVDYGIGNLHSAHKALERMGADARLTADPELIADAAAVVLPGVGAFAACMAALRTSGVEDAVREAAGSGRPFLGICVGMQMLFGTSEESDPAGRSVEGLGIIPGRVEWLPDAVKRPQMQWNRLLVSDRADPLFDGLTEGAWMYFVHSLQGVPDDRSVVLATCQYGGSVNAAFRLGSVVATQFHPEKSGSTGLRLLGNFVHIAAGASA